MQSQFQFTQSEATNLREHAIMTQKHLELFRDTIEDLEQKIVEEYQEKQQIKQRLQNVSNVDVDRLVDLVADAEGQGCNHQIKDGLGRAVQMILGLVVGELQGEEDPQNDQT